VFETVHDWLLSKGLQGQAAEYTAWAIATLGVIVLAVIVAWLTRRILLTILSVLIKRTPTHWDDALLERKVLHRASHVAPALVFYWLAPTFQGLQGLIERLAMGYILVAGGLVFSAFISAAVDVYQRLEISRNRPVKGFAQLAKIILGVLIAVLVIAVLFDQSPLGLLGGLGAMTAVLILVFKDTILGLVASFQISTTNLVRVGDWIEMPKFGADGTVTDISLHTIRVQNWDKTISTVPTYSLISDSFKNWRGMEESGGRRIKRSINIDVNSIKFCTEEMIERFTRYQYITAYIREKKEELARYNTERKIDTTFLVNGRHMTNVGTFRAYVEAYLRNHPDIRPDMTFLVRQLQPGEHGLPIEIYVFSKIQEWARYESLQADILDHILAVVPQFDLRAFQQPTGADFGRLVQ
jgi:miniconductance mechanosensitive channel